jgi:DNA-binding beta-propeller fold protein YncE
MVNLATGIISLLYGASKPILPQLSGNAAYVRYPVGVTVDKSGLIYIADSGNNRIITVKNNTNTLVATVIVGSSTVAGSSGNVGPSSMAMLNFPRGVSFDYSGNMYFCDQNNHNVMALQGEEYLHHILTITKTLCRSSSYILLFLSSPSFISSPYHIVIEHC